MNKFTYEGDVFYGVVDNILGNQIVVLTEDEGEEYFVFLPIEETVVEQL